MKRIKPTVIILLLIFLICKNTNTNNKLYIIKKIKILNQRLYIGFTPITLEAAITVKGLVIALANPNPHATIHTKKPV